MAGRTFPAQLVANRLFLRASANVLLAYLPAVAVVDRSWGPDKSPEDWVCLHGQVWMQKKATKDMEWEVISEELASSVSRDLAELVAFGDTDLKEDKFLTVLDGLQKLTKWPDRLEIADPISVRQDETEKDQSYDITVHIRWVWEK